MNELMNALERIIQDAGALMMSKEHAAVHQKEGHSNFVTDADFALQAFLKDALLKLLPDSAFFAEEQENERLTARPTWMVDPLDGTLNFMRARRCSAVSVALLVECEPVLAAVYNPYANELFTAKKDGIACCNGREIAVSGVPFDRAMIAMGTSPYNAALAARTCAIAREMLLQGGDLRRTGSAALDLCDVACGRSDVFFELQLSPWDYAAGALIVQRAGGRMAAPGAARLVHGEKNPILAANPVCFEQALRIITNA